MHGVSKHHSPRMMLHKEKIAFDSHCAHGIRECVQGEKDPDRSNSNAPRTLDYLNLRSSCDAQKCYDLLHLQTNKVLDCRKIWRMPVTTSVMQQAHTLARMHGVDNKSTL